MPALARAIGGLSGNPPMGQPLAHRGEDRPGSSPLKNPAHEKLAREYAAGASMAEAWRAVHRGDPADHDGSADHISWLLTSLRARSRTDLLRPRSRARTRQQPLSIEKVGQLGPRL